MPEAVAAGVADQLKAFTFVVAVTETDCPTATSVDDAVNEIALESVFDLLHADTTVTISKELKRAFFIIAFLVKAFL